MLPILALFRLGAPVGFAIVFLFTHLVFSEFVVAPALKDTRAFEDSCAVCRKHMQVLEEHRLLTPWWPPPPAFRVHDQDHPDFLRERCYVRAKTYEQFVSMISMSLLVGFVVTLAIALTSSVIGFIRRRLRGQTIAGQSGSGPGVIAPLRKAE